MTHEIYLFGSVTRGEVSASSDVDVLVVPLGEYDRTQYPREWSVYSRETIQEYFDKGRLFAWHLSLEAKCVFTPFARPWLDLLGQPAGYSSVRQDVDELQSLLRQSLDELRAGTKSVIYELGICYTAVRDIAMSVSWAWDGRPNFSRMAPFELSVQCPVAPSSYGIAMGARHASARGAPMPAGLEAARRDFLSAPFDEWISRLAERL